MTATLFRNIVTAALMLSTGTTLVLAQEFVSRYTNVEAISSLRSPIHIKSAEVERLASALLLTVSMRNQADHIVHRVRLQLEIYDAQGRIKGREEWRKSIDLVAGNNAEIDVELKYDVQFGDRLILKLISAK